MNISGIRPYAEFYEYNSIKLHELRLQQIAQVKDAGNGTDLSGVASQNADNYAEVRSRQTYSAADYAKEYNPNASYELKGADSDLNSLDVEKALSGLEKDQVLMQYQFFVGTEGAKENTKASSAVRDIENFNI